MHFHVVFLSNNCLQSQIMIFQYQWYIIQNVCKIPYNRVPIWYWLLLCLMQKLNHLPFHGYLQLKELLYYMHCNFSKLVWFSSSLGIRIQTNIDLLDWLLQWLNYNNPLSTQLRLLQWLNCNNPLSTQLLCPYIYSLKNEFWIVIYT